MPVEPATYSDVRSCVDSVLQKARNDIRLGIPLGLGKANHVVNDFYRRAAEDPCIQPHINTAISLAAPKRSTDLERMNLTDPQNAKETLMQRAVVYRLTSIGAI